ncbi:hypothetical protein F5Y08DRAFT_341404 [Xylaria arbuscula]|nr:hypothetical protein F5Y08DRAFT_341404 [Xylaria arbuscula]
MEPSDGPDGPPPPYSETDIHSHPHSSRINHLGVADDDSIAPSSSHSNIIDTPPESPHDAHHSFAGPNSDYHVTASAQDYFDSHPPSQLRPGPMVSVVVEIRPHATPADFPYPNWAAERDVSVQDWQTFVNYLIPDHAAKANSHIIDRKIRVASDDGHSSGVSDDTRAQLTPLKSSATASSSPQSIETTAREWNQGFFEPRGVKVHCTSTADHVAEQEAQGANPADAERSQNQPRQSSSWWRNPFAFVDGSNGSLRLGPLHIEGDRVAVGSNLQADSNGVRWRGQPNGPSFEASSRGVFGWGAPPAPHPGHPFAHQRGSWSGPFGDRRGRGRDSGHGHGHRRRNHSRSSTSSSSSSSSSDSDSSIGSLPDWDDLKDVQLPVTKRSVQAWLLHPAQPVTRDMVKRAGSEIKAAKNVSLPPHDPSWDRARENLRREVKDLLQQFKLLKKQQKAAKKKARKELRQRKRAAKQERRERRRAERQERRATRRGERDAERHGRRAGRHERPQGPSIPGIPSVPHPPPPPGPPSFPPFSGGFGGFFGRGPFGQQQQHQQQPNAPGFGFHRGFGGGGRGRGRGRGQSPGPSSYNVAEQANRAVAEAVSAAEKEVERSLAQANKTREDALAHAAEQQRAAAATAALSVEESRRVATMAAEESRRVATAAVSRATVDSKLAQALVLEGQLAAKASQVQALEVRIAEAGKREEEHGEEKKKSVESQGVDVREHDLQAVEKLEYEMDLLARKVETLRFEADEELARGLADGDGGWGGWR